MQALGSTTIAALFLLLFTSTSGCTTNADPGTPNDMASWSVQPRQVLVTTIALTSNGTMGDDLPPPAARYGGVYSGAYAMDRLNKSIQTEYLDDAWRVRDRDHMVLVLDQRHSPVWEKSQVYRFSSPPGMATRIDISDLGTFWASAYEGFVDIMAGPYTFSSPYMVGRNQEGSFAMEWTAMEWAMDDSGVLVERPVLYETDVAVEYLGWMTLRFSERTESHYTENPDEMDEHMRLRQRWHARDAGT